MNYSFSQIKTVNSCPYHYKKLYIDNDKESANLPALFGMAIHAVFKDIIAKKIDKKESIKLWRWYLEKEIAENNDIVIMKNYDFWLKRGYPTIQQFHKNVNNLNISEIIKIEERCVGIYDNENFSYVCDLVYSDNNKDIVILDYKTGKHKELDFYQLAFYKQLMNIEKCKLCLYYIWEKPILFDSETYYSEMIKFISRGLSVIKSCKFEKNKSADCKYCKFLSTECRVS